MPPKQTRVRQLEGKEGGTHSKTIYKVEIYEGKTVESGHHMIFFIGNHYSKLHRVDKATTMHFSNIFFLLKKCRSIDYICCVLMPRQCMGIQS